MGVGPTGSGSPSAGCGAGTPGSSGTAGWTGASGTAGEIGASGTAGVEVHEGKDVHHHFPHFPQPEQFSARQGSPLLLPAREGFLVRPQQPGEERVAEVDLCFEPLHARTQGVFTVFLKVVRDR